MVLAIAMALQVVPRAWGQDNSKDAPAATTPAKPKLSQEELEAKFKATLTQATMSGRWCGLKNGKLTPEKEDKYTIVSVNKLGGEAWIISARIQYGNKDFVAPIPILVKWAGDTPVITLDNVGLPGGSSYSARVLIYNNTYAGTWSGGDHGGLMNGVITNEKEKDQDKDQDKDKEKEKPKE
jgi:hypothetical protein